MTDTLGLQDAEKRITSSEYHSRYREYEFQPRMVPMKPRHVGLPQDDSMETTTTQKLSFPEHPVARQQAIKPADNNLASQGQHDFTSSYSTAFLGPPGQRAKAIRNDKERQDPGNFMNETSNKADFKEWLLPPRHQRTVATWQPPADPFQATSTAHKDFISHDAGARAAVMKRRDEWAGPRGGSPIEGYTGYKDSFKEHQLPPRRQRVKQEWTQPAVGFDATSTAHSSYTGPVQPRRQPFKPSQETLRSDVPFDASTTSKADYQEKPLGEKFVHGGAMYQRPEGKMNLMTTTATEFKEFPVSRREVTGKPPSSNLLRGKGSMATESGYSVNFMGQTAPRRDMLRPKNAYSAPKEKFEGLSTAKGDFIEKELSPRQSYRPQWGTVATDAPFETATENKDNFVGMAIPPRFMREAPTYVAPSVRFDASTTQADSYQGKVGEKPKMLRPNQLPATTAAPALPEPEDNRFQGSTTMQADFTEQQLSPRHRHLPDRYVPPEGIMNMMTSQREAFKDQGRPQRLTAARPGSSHLLTRDGKFQGGTSYAGAFTMPEAQGRREMVRPAENYQRSAGPFEGTTTMQADFKGAYAPRQQGFRPPPRPLQHLDAFEDNLRPQGYPAATPLVPPITA